MGRVKVIVAVAVGFGAAIAVAVRVTEVEGGNVAGGVYETDVGIWLDNVPQTRLEHGEPD